MIPRLTLEEFRDAFLSRKYNAVVCTTFLGDTRLAIAEQARKYLSTNALAIDSKVGAAYERLASADVGCSKSRNQQIDLSILDSKIRDLLGGCSDLASYFSVVQFNPLQGMTSHRDYSYNRYLLGTFVLEGQLLFGVGVTRETAYYDNVILMPGDFIALQAPQGKIDDRRPYFWTCAIEPDQTTLAIRTWLRDCKSGVE